MFAETALVVFVLLICAALVVTDVLEDEDQSYYPVPDLDDEI